jgi:hypothetical protein
MRWVPVESSVFTAFSYLRSKRELYLEFRSGDVYRYFDFPPEQFEDFVKAESKGQYFAHNIRDRFRFELVRRLSEVAALHDVGGRKQQGGAGE